MKFDIRCFNDLGKCSYGTLKEYFDTEKDNIYLFDKNKGYNVKVEIKTIDDLLPFLWCEPSVQFCDNAEGTSKTFFGEKKPWWEYDFTSNTKETIEIVNHIEERKKDYIERIREVNKNLQEIG